MTDTLESACREWLEAWNINEHVELAPMAWMKELRAMSSDLASFVREQVLAERRRCVDVVATDKICAMLSEGDEIYPDGYLCEMKRGYDNYYSILLATKEQDEK